MTIELLQESKRTATLRAAEAALRELAGSDAADYGMPAGAAEMSGADDEFLDLALLDDLEEDGDEDWDFEAFRTEMTVRA